jgi:uncharacterized protein (TIGR04255 family)
MARTFASIMEQSNYQYPNAPIQEAVCEFRFPAGQKAWDLAFPGLIYNELRDSFPRRIQPEQPQQVFSVAFSNPQQFLGGFPPGDPSQSLRFWKEDSEDGVVTIAPNRISISHYRPYPGWAEFYNSIQKAYSAYLDIAQPRSIERVGLRYLNLIDFGTPGIQLAKFFSYFPQIGESLPQNNQNVRISVEFPYQNVRDIARLQLTTRPGPNQDSIAVQLDIDYFLVIAGTIGLDQMREWLGHAHTAIGELFEGSITEEARHMFRG